MQGQALPADITMPVGVLKLTDLCAAAPCHAVLNSNLWTDKKQASSSMHDCGLCSFAIVAVM